MISVNNYNKKLVPTINFLDIYSIQNWINLRKLSNEFGSSLFIRYKGLMVISLLLIIILSCMILLFDFRDKLSYLAKYNDYIIILENFIIKDLIILFIWFIRLLILLSNYNYTYEKDQDNINILIEKINYYNTFKSSYICNLLKENKSEELVLKYNYDIISYQFYSLKSNFFYLKCTKYLMKKYNENLLEEVNNSLNNLHDYLDQQLNYFEFIKNRKSFKILGLLLNYRLLKIMLFGVLPYYFNFIINYKIKFSNK